MFFLQYIRWHYIKGISALVKNSKNILLAIWRFCGIWQLLRTLFYPWSRLQEKYRKNAGIGQWASTLILNTMMRIVGAGVRLVVAIFGISALILSAFLFVIACITWLVWPAFIGGLLVLFFVSL